MSLKLVNLIIMFQVSKLKNILLIMVYLVIVDTGDKFKSNIFILKEIVIIRVISN